MNILIVRVSAIGDVIHTMPAVFLLKHHFPHATIHWVVQKKAAHLLVDQPLIDHVWILPDKYLNPGNVKQTVSTILKLRRITWDMIIDFQGLLKTAALILPLKGKKFGFATPHARESISTWSTHHHDSPTYTNIVQKNLSLASTATYHVGAPTTSPSTDTLYATLTLATPPEKQKLVDTWLAENQVNNALLLCPNTTWPSKHWPDDHWTSFINLVKAAQLPLTPILVGTAFGNAAKNIASATGTTILQCPPWDLITTAHLIKQARVIIAPDTGLLHLADFFGTPAIGIFGPTNKEKHGPFWSTINKAACLQVACPHVYQKTHGPSNAPDCMATLTPEHLLDQLRILLTQNRRFS